MFQKRSFPAFVLMASLSAAAVASVVMPTDATAADLDCSKIKNATVKKYCAEKGKNTTVLMRKQMEAWSDTAGDDYDKCTSCHKSAKGGELKPGAEDKWADFAKKAKIE